VTLERLENPIRSQSGQFIPHREKKTAVEIPFNFLCLRKGSKVLAEMRLSAVLLSAFMM